MCNCQTQAEKRGLELQFLSMSMLGKHLQHQILLQGSLFHKEIYFFYTEELHW